ncbi:MAG: hypothetical protein U5J83_09640 [Bryobacterales bacterium]|nr:hypothetical protein [Bryobacterales bacterium]
MAVAQAFEPVALKRSVSKAAIATIKRRSAISPELRLYPAQIKML